MKIQLKRLYLENFKGLTKIDINFIDNQLELRGANGTGKTSVYDAFLWLLFDKDSTGRKDFEIKTLSKDGKTKPDIEHLVEGRFEIDGTEVNIKKVYREKWVRKRGSKEAEFTGNETTYFWNNVPLKKNEYTSKINDIISDEDTFRLLSDVRYFNSLTWDKRRQILFSLIDTKTLPIDEFETIHLKGKTSDELRKELNASKKKLLFEIDQIPVRIDEISRTLETNIEITDTTEIEKELQSISQQLKVKTIESEQYDIQISGLRDKEHDIVSRLRAIRDKYSDDLRSQLRQIDQQFNEIRKQESLLSTDISIKESKILQFENQLIEYDNQLNSLRNEYKLIVDQVFSDSLSCPTCGSQFDETRKNELINKFNIDKSKKLEQINIKGLDVKSKVESYRTDLFTLQNEVIELKTNLDAIRKNVESNNEYFDFDSKLNKLLSSDESYEFLKNEFNKINEQISNFSNPINTGDLIVRNNELNQQLNSIKFREYEARQQRDNHLKRIEELKSERLKFLDKLSEVEKTEYELTEYSKRKIETIEHHLKQIFNGIGFKMFDVQINGGITETCVVQLNGVPYSDLNTASKIWVSLNIISTFSKIQNLQVPIFIDNRESITILPEMSQQTISLIVDPSCKTLKIK